MKSFVHTAPLRGVALACVAVIAALLPHGDDLHAAGASLTVLHTFPTDDNSGFQPNGLIQASDGSFYGTTQLGGGLGCGTLYKATAAGVMTQLHVFGLGSSATYACQPVGSLLEGLDGKLYGASQYSGVAFRIDVDGDNFEVIKQFNSTPGGFEPNGSLAQGADGTLYGTTLIGGANGNGVVYRMAPDGSGYTVLHSFASDPEGQVQNRTGVLLASDGYLYGTLSSGPTANGGVFRIATDGTGYTLIHAYTGNANGVQSEAPLIEGADGKLYGVGFAYVNQGSCGSGCVTYSTSFVVFSMAKDGSGKSNVHTFSNTWPVGGLAVGSDGLLYGVARQVPGDVSGGIYRVATNGTGYALVHTFGATAADGEDPRHALAAGADNKLYGVTETGGTADAGVLFSLTTAGVETVLHTFGTTSDGYRPVAGVIIGVDGMLYGATSRGGDPYIPSDPTGAHGSEGTVFRLNADGSGHDVLHSFTFATDDASVPLGTPIQGLDGAIYGTTTDGGAITSAGAVYRVTTDGSSESLVHSFNFCAPCNEGFHPSAGVIQAGDGTLYGTADAGGQSPGAGRGVIYKVQPNATGYGLLHSFTGGTDGSYPRAPVLLAGDGRLYGTASSGGGSGCGGSGCGTLFGIDTDGTDYSTLRAFLGGDDGAWPKGALIEAVDGYLYGTTSAGAGVGCDGNGCGTVFRIAADGSDYQVLHAFTGGDDGATPVAALVQAADGTLYGTTQYGGGTGCGGSGCGTVFRIAASGAYSVAYAFAGLDGARPLAALTLGAGGELYGTTSHGGGLLDGGTVFVMQDTATFLPAPTGLTATAGDGEVVLDWTASAGASSYNVYEGTATGATSAVPVMSVTATTATVTGLANGTDYFFVVRAVGGADHSAASNETTATPFGPPDVTLTVAPTSITLGQNATLTWNTSNVTTCTASNAWSGAQATGGTQNVSPTAVGTYTYVLSCTGPGAAVEGTAVLVVSAAPASGGGGGGGGGGALGGPTMLLLALAALRRRRFSPAESRRP